VASLAQLRVFFARRLASMWAATRNHKHVFDRHGKHPYLVKAQSWSHSFVLFTSFKPPPLPPIESTLERGNVVLVFPSIVLWTLRWDPELNKQTLHLCRPIGTSILLLLRQVFQLHGTIEGGDLDGVVEHRRRISDVQKKNI
jgi:hypothetical protein